MPGSGDEVSCRPTLHQDECKSGANYRHRVLKCDPQVSSRAVQILLCEHTARPDGPLPRLIRVARTQRHAITNGVPDDVLRFAIDIVLLAPSAAVQQSAPNDAQLSFRRESVPVSKAPLLLHLISPERFDKLASSRLFLPGHQAFSSSQQRWRVLSRIGLLQEIGSPRFVVVQMGKMEKPSEESRRRACTVSLQHQAAQLG